MTGSRTIRICFVCCVYVCTGRALKLTPLNFDRVTDITHETKLVAAAYEKGIPLLDRTTSTSHTTDVHKAIRRLHTAIERWIQAEGRFRAAISSGSPTEMRKFDEAVHVVARTRALLGRLYIRASQDMLAVTELESACPVLWELQVAVHHTKETQSWLNCYAVLSELYVKLGRVDDAEQLERALLLRMPWLAGADGRNARDALDMRVPQRDCNRPLAVLGRLSRLSRSEQEQNPCNRRYREPVFTQVANATHAAWRYAEELRSYLNDLVSEFSLADSIRRQVAVYKRALSVVDTVIEKYVSSQGIEQEVVSYADFSAGIYEEAPMTTADNDTGSSDDREAASLTDVRILLRNEILMEASFYVSIMEGAIENGVDFINSEKHKLSASTAQQVLPNEHGEHAPQGFQSKAEVAEVFVYFLSRAGSKLPTSGEERETQQNQPKAPVATRGWRRVVQFLVTCVCLVIMVLCSAASGLFVHSSAVNLNKKAKARQKAVSVAAKRRGEANASFGTFVVRAKRRLVIRLEQLLDKLIDAISNIQDATITGISNVRRVNFSSLFAEKSKRAQVARMSKTASNTSTSGERRRKRTFTPKSTSSVTIKASTPVQTDSHTGEPLTIVSEAETVVVLAQTISSATSEQSVVSETECSAPEQLQLLEPEAQPEACTSPEEKPDEQLQSQEDTEDCRSHCTEQVTSRESSPSPDATDEEDASMSHGTEPLVPQVPFVKLSKPKPRPHYKTRLCKNSGDIPQPVRHEGTITPPSVNFGPSTTTSQNAAHTILSQTHPYPPPYKTRATWPVPGSDPRGGTAMRTQSQRRVSRTPSPGVCQTAYLVRHHSCPFPDLIELSAGSDSPTNHGVGNIVITEELKEHVLHQIEYYFSIENLCKDLYLRSKMDKKGFVRLAEIARFNRIVAFGVDPWVLLQAVQKSTQLEVAVPWAVKACGEEIAQSHRAILDTKIRTRDHPERWVLGQDDSPRAMSPSKMAANSP